MVVTGNVPDLKAYRPVRGIIVSLDCPPGARDGATSQTHYTHLLSSALKAAALYYLIKYSHYYSNIHTLNSFTSSLFHANVGLDLIIPPEM